MRGMRERRKGTRKLTTETTLRFHPGMSTMKKGRTTRG